MTDPEPSQTQGFSMSSRRMATEIAIVASVLVGGVLLIVWGAGALAARLIGVIPVSVDQVLGEQVARVMRSSSNVCTSEEPVQYVRTVTKPLLDALGDTPFEFSFVVVEDEAINAFALPGGYVTVNMGLLNAAETGSEVAAVLAHEIFHVIERHGTKRMLRQLGGATVLYAVFGGTEIALPASIVSDLTHTAYDRDQERESDALGQALMIRAGLDPGGMARFFERLAQQGGAPPELLSTHPDPGGRAAAARNAAEGARATTTLPAPGKLRCQTP